MLKINKTTKIPKQIRYKNTKHKTQIQTFNTKENPTSKQYTPKYKHKDYKYQTA
jgi:hypothetical protein